MNPHSAKGCAIVGLWHACIAGRLTMASIGLIMHTTHPSQAQQSQYSPLAMINTHVTLFLAITALLAALVFLFEPIRGNIAPASTSAAIRETLIDDHTRKDVINQHHARDDIMKPSTLLCAILASWYVSLAGCLWTGGRLCASWAGVHLVVTIFLTSTTVSVALVGCGLINKDKRIAPAYIGDLPHSICCMDAGA